MKEVAVTVPRSEFERYGLEDLFAIWQDRDVQFWSVWCGGSRGTAIVRSNRRIDVETISAVSYLSGVELLNEEPGGYEYMMDVDLPQLRGLAEDHVGEFFLKDGVEFGEDGVSFTVVGSPEALRSLEEGLSALTDESLSEFQVERVNEYRGRRTPLAMLTDRQLTVLRKAYANGYYDIPREISSDELADRFGVEKSTILELLRRAERNLLSDLFDEDEAEPARQTG